MIESIIAHLRFLWGISSVIGKHNQSKIEPPEIQKLQKLVSDTINSHEITISWLKRTEMSAYVAAEKGSVNGEKSFEVLNETRKEIRRRKTEIKKLSAISKKLKHIR